MSDHAVTAEMFGLPELALPADVINGIGSPALLAHHETPESDTELSYWRRGYIARALNFNRGAAPTSRANLSAAWHAGYDAATRDKRAGQLWIVPVQAPALDTPVVSPQEFMIDGEKMLRHAERPPAWVVIVTGHTHRFAEVDVIEEAKDRSGRQKVSGTVRAIVDLVPLPEPAAEVTDAAE